MKSIEFTVIHTVVYDIFATLLYCESNTHVFQFIFFFPTFGDARGIDFSTAIRSVVEIFAITFCYLTVDRIKPMK